MFGLRLPELLVVLVVFVFMFGSKKLPELGDSLGKGIRAFKKAAEHGFDSDEARPAAPKAQDQLSQGSATTTPASAPREKAKGSDGGTV